MATTRNTSSVSSTQAEKGGVIDRPKQPQIPDDVLRVMNAHLTYPDLTNLAKTAKTNFLFFPNRNTKLELLRGRFLQVVIDDDIPEIKNILDNNRTLLAELLLEKQTPIIRVIESKKTWQRFCSGRAPLELAIQRKQVEVVKVLLPYYDILEKQDKSVRQQSYALQQWELAEKKEEYQLECMSEKEFKDRVGLFLIVR